MRKTLIAAVVAAALFAIGAFAANFGVDSEQVVSGNDTVDQCAFEVEVEFATGAYDESLGTDGDFPVTAATANFVDDAGDPDDGCNGLDATLSLGDGVDFDSVAGVSGTSASFGPLDVPVGEIDVVAILVEGRPVPVVVT